MGGKQIEFEVERRRGERLVSGKDEAKKQQPGEPKGEEYVDDGSWQSYFENPKTIDNMKFFVMAQSIVMFLTYGLPHMQKAFDLLREAIFGR